VVDALKANGIRIVSSANNHMMDQGWAGFAETRNHLREQGMLSAGTCRLGQQELAAGDHRGNRHQSRWLGNERAGSTATAIPIRNQPHVNFFPYAANPKARGDG